MRSIVVLVAGAAMVAACGSSPEPRSGAGSEPTSPTTIEITAPTNTSAPTMTTSASSSSSSSSAPPTSTNPVVPPDGVWDPPCAERPATSAPDPIADEGALDTFGPLGATPILDITVPLGRSVRSESPTAPIVGSARVPRGLLLLIRPSSYDSFDSWWLTSIDTTGGVRWLRCEDGTVGISLAVGPASDSPTVALVDVLVPNAGAPPTHVWHAIDLATGLDVAPPSGIDGLQLLASAGRYALFGPPNDGVINLESDRMTVLDLVRLESAEIPLPGEADDRVPLNVSFSITDDGTVVFPEPNSFRAITAVYRDGEWRNDAPSILDSSPIRVEFSFDGGVAELQGRNGLGDVVWSRPELTDIGNEGFRTATSDDVTVVSACVTPSVETGCAEVALLGIVTQTGEIRWRLPGRREVSALGDGFAIVTDPSDVPLGTTPEPPGYMMIDTATGLEVGGDQRWEDPDTFRTACCGESEFVWVHRDGGVVIATNNDHVGVWYPAAIDAQTRSVRIGG